jgi:hypothetical protein
VPNTKVLANIQIYVHTKFPIFLISLNISFQFISHLYGKSNKTGIQIGKGVSGVFLCTGLFLQCPRGHLCVRAQPAARYRSVVAASRAPRVIRPTGQRPFSLRGPTCRGSLPPILPCSRARRRPVENPVASPDQSPRRQRRSASRMSARFLKPICPLSS